MSVDKLLKNSGNEVITRTHTCQSVLYLVRKSFFFLSICVISTKLCNVISTVKVNRFGVQKQFHCGPVISCNCEIQLIFLAVKMNNNGLLFHFATAFFLFMRMSPHFCHKSGTSYDFFCINAYFLDCLATKQKFPANVSCWHIYDKKHRWNFVEPNTPS